MSETPASSAVRNPHPKVAACPDDVCNATSMCLSPGECHSVPDLVMTIWYPLCDGPCATDGTSWWCEMCGATWNRDGEKGEMPR